MLKHNRLATSKRRKQLDSVQVVDSSAWQNRNGPAREGSASKECLDGGHGHQIDWLGTWRGGEHAAAVDWGVVLFRHFDYKPDEV
jgi:hypothetical protein